MSLSVMYHGSRSRCYVSVVLKNLQYVINYEHFVFGSNHFIQFVLLSEKRR